MYGLSILGREFMACHIISYHIISYFMNDAWIGWLVVMVF